MEKLWALEANIFSIVAVGFVIRKLKAVPKEAERVITDLVLNVILPCNIFVSFLGNHSGVGLADYIAIFLVSIGIQMLSLLYSKFAFPKQNEDRRCSLSYAMICSNAGFLGNPVAEGVFGPIGLMLTSIYLIPQRIMMWSEGLAIYSSTTDLKSSIKKVLVHPCVIACLLGILAMTFSIRLPSIVLDTVQSIGRCNTPLTMLMIGMLLSEIDLRALADKTILWFTLHRLVLMPLTVYVVCSLLGLNHAVTGVSTILAAMPAGATTTMLAAKYDRDPKFAARLVIFTTLCSIPAILVWSMILM